MYVTTLVTMDEMLFTVLLSMSSIDSTDITVAGTNREQEDTSAQELLH